MAPSSGWRLIPPLVAVRPRCRQAGITVWQTQPSVIPVGDKQRLMERDSAL